MFDSVGPFEISQLCVIGTSTAFIFKASLTNAGYAAVSSGAHNSFTVLASKNCVFFCFRMVRLRRFSLIVTDHLTGRTGSITLFVLFAPMYVLQCYFAVLFSCRDHNV